MTTRPTAGAWSAARSFISMTPGATIRRATARCARARSAATATPGATAPRMSLTNSTTRRHPVCPDRDAGTRGPTYEIGNYGAARFEIQETANGATRRLAVVDTLVDAERIVDALLAWGAVCRGA